MDTCPKCNSKRVHRSRTRSAFERFRRDLTGKVPFRCEDCGWRGWAADTGPVSGHGGTPPFREQEHDLDLRTLDSEVPRNQEREKKDDEDG